MGRPSRYPDEFRREALALALSTDDSRASVARRLGGNETTLRNWVAGGAAQKVSHHASTGVCNVLVPDLAVPSSPP